MTPSLIVLCAANALPIVGVLFLGWTVFPLVLLYWIENVVVGAFNVLKMLLARPQEMLYNLGKLFFVPFFVVHFGLFTFVHGTLVFALFGPRDADPFGITANLFPTIRAHHLGWAVLVIALSHGLSFYWNYLGNGEFRRASMPILMQQPYGRVMVMHFTVLFGGWIVMTLGSPVLALVLLVVLKTAADIRAHRAERRRFAPSELDAPATSG